MEKMIRVPVMVVRKPINKRSPVRKDLNFLATAVADDVYSGNKKYKKLKFDGQTALYDGIIKLVYKNAFSYANHRSDFDDLTQSCLTRIWEKLYSFDMNKASFSTWAWKVCKNVLNGDYLKKKKIYDPLDGNGEERYNTIEGKDTNEHLSDAIKHVVRDIHSRFPKHSIIIDAMFGGGSVGNYNLPDRFCIAEIARRANSIKRKKLEMNEDAWERYVVENPKEEIHYMNCYIFHREHILPIFKKHFK
jgi:RNA polymerase sigma factor (sigma-70 family)